MNKWEIKYCYKGVLITKNCDHVARRYYERWCVTKGGPNNYIAKHFRTLKEAKKFGQSLI